MRERGRGGIVLMGSGAGLGGQPGVAVYSGVKGFVLNLAESLWAELGGSGVDVIGIAARVRETPALRQTTGDREIPGIYDTPEEVRNATTRLSTSHTYTTAITAPPQQPERPKKNRTGQRV